MNNKKYINCRIDPNLTPEENITLLKKRYYYAWVALALSKKLNRTDDFSRVLSQITLLRNNIRKLLDFL